MLTPLHEHTLLVFWIQLLVLLIVARSLGALMTRFGQPAVVGELAAGFLVGPSVFGRLAPDAAGWLFPGDELQSGVLLSVAWLGAFLLLMVTGFETDLSLLSRLGRSSASVAAGSLVVPLAAGFGIGWLMPSVFHGERGGSLTFALFMGVALSISALPVVARILSDMQLMRRNVGQVILAAAMVNDLIGWLLLGAIAGLAQSGSMSLGRVLVTLGAVLTFIGLALTVGQKATDAVLRRSLKGPLTATLTAAVLIALVAGTVTQAIGVEAVLGAFVAGIVLGRSRYFGEPARETVERVTESVFAPLFFATSGLYVDVGRLAEGRTAFWALVVLLVAAGTKLVGSAAGGWIGRLRPAESLAVGFGLNARGAMEIVLATVALGVGVFNTDSYTLVVLMAMATSLAAPPLLRRSLRRFDPQPEEAARLQQEELMSQSRIAQARTALLPTRGGRNSVVAAWLLNLALRDEASVTVLTVARPDAPEDGDSSDLLRVLSAFPNRQVERRTARGDQADEAILTESRLEYDLIAVGLNEDFSGGHHLGPVIKAILLQATVPVLVVRRGQDLDGEGIPRIRFQRIVVPATGTGPGQAAEEIAYSVAARTGARIDAVHVVSRADQTPVPVPSGATATPAVRSVLSGSIGLAKRFGNAASGIVRTGQYAHEELLAAARERRANLIVLGTQLRSREGVPFLGHGVEFLLEHAPQTVAVVVFPLESDTTG